MKPAAEVIEDLEFLDEQHVGALEAAQRTGFPSAEALEKWLERNDAYDLWMSLKKRDPEGAHSEKARRQRMTENVPTTHPLTALLDEAESSTVAKHRRKAERIRTLLADLKTELDSDRERRQAEAEARAAVERLQEQLAEAKAALKQAASGGKKVAAPTGPKPAQIRAWAVANNVACPKAGRVPGAVVDAYLAATEQVSA